MFLIIDILIAGGTLWLLMIVFNESGRFDMVKAEAGICLGAVILAGFLLGLLLPDGLRLLKPLGQAIVLYFTLGAVGGFSQKASLKIVIWFFAILFVVGLFFALISQ